MKYATEIASGGMIYIPSFISCYGGYPYRNRQQDDLISLLLRSS
jgi:hypothetical protein